jgi:hypothetical protein
VLRRYNLRRAQWKWFYLLIRRRGRRRGIWNFKILIFLYPQRSETRDEYLVFDCLIIRLFGFAIERERGWRCLCWQKYVWGDLFWTWGVTQYDAFDYAGFGSLWHWICLPCQVVYKMMMVKVLHLLAKPLRRSWVVYKMMVKIMPPQFLKKNFSGTWLNSLS